VHYNNKRANDGEESQRKTKIGIKEANYEGSEGGRKKEAEVKNRLGMMCFAEEIR
jgi:hypothetical protein